MSQPLEGARDLVYLPAEVLHLRYNLSDSESCTAVVARTDLTSKGVPRQRQIFTNSQMGEPDHVIC
jgi:uncharacterized RmlC-like cupin family protein